MNGKEANEAIEGMNERELRLTLNNVLAKAFTLSKQGRTVLTRDVHDMVIEEIDYVVWCRQPVIWIEREAEK